MRIRYLCSSEREEREVTVPKSVISKCDDSVGKDSDELTGTLLTDGAEDSPASG